jgi:pimeloyl-ACP methyl ester carboxylesterase
MPPRALLALALLAGASCAETADPSSDDAYPFPTGDGKADSIQLASLPVAMGTPTAGSFDQEIDHPDAPAPSLGTFKQRYWYALDFARGPDSPVLFYLCGEAPCSPWYASSMADAAKALNAAVVVLEHRYYGTSLPYPDLTLDHMKYLTIHNALEDAAAFERYARANLPLKGKWIVVGGSYPGMLAAFYREKHPELVVGAWASSAPINVALSFWGYDAIATRALGPTCALLFQQVLASAGEAYDDPAQRDGLANALFGVAAPDSKVQFLQWFSYTAEGAAQYGETRQLCAALEQERDHPVDGFAGYLNPPLVDDGDGTPDAGTPDAPPTDHPVATGAAIPRLILPPARDNFAGSQWFYQVCTEVGFYQIHNPDRTQSIMSDLVTEDYWRDRCQELVGTAPAIASTRAAYVEPILRGEVSNLFFVNGSLDPWSSLSLTDARSAPAGVTAFVVQTGSHCEDLDNLTQDSVLGVFQAHKRFHDLARAWLR